MVDANSRQLHARQIGVMVKPEHQELRRQARMPAEVPEHLSHDVKGAVHLSMQQALEGKGLIRPLRRNEWAYRLQPVQAKAFNRELSRHRARIEQVMARLKRFRILGNRFSLALEGYPAVMKTAALIHNMEQVAA